MEAYLVEWLNLLLRWLHIITGVAWIGASFYFVWLDNHLQAPKKQQDADGGVGGELWAVHGGGFYHAQKYKLAPPALPSTLHWFKWEAYSTWLSGIFLLALMYWYGAQVYTLDSNVMALSQAAAISIGIACIVGGWLIYDGLCRSPLGKNDTILATLIALLTCILAYGLCQVFSGRAAFIHFGAVLGTIMVANVFFVIIPGQKAMVAAASTGQQPDPIHGLRGRQRSVHNTFFTLPVLLVMVSNHYAMTYSHTLNWLVLIGLCAAGGLIRIYFVQRHFGKAKWPVLAAAIATLATLAWLIAPKPATTATTYAASAPFNQVQNIIQTRCASCHAAAPTQAGFSAPPKGILLETPAQISSQAEAIHQQSVLSRAMPIGNLSQMTDAEREVLEQWFAQGAAVQP